MRRPSNEQIGFVERLMFSGLRAWVVSQARGTVVEIAVGTGLNLPLYGPAVQRVEFHHGDVQARAGSRLCSRAKSVS